MNQKKNLLIVILLCANLTATVILAGAFFIYVEKPGADLSEEGASSINFESKEKGKYTLYIGTNDKDTYKQIIPTDEAKEIVNAICVKYVGGYTSQDACGGWVDDTNQLTQENTLVYQFYGVTEDQMVSIMDEVLDKLNQTSILIEAEDANYAYYYGPND